MRPPESLLLIGARPPPAGGIATHVEELARAVADAQIPVRVLDPRRRGPNGHLPLGAALLRARLRGELVHIHENGHNPKSWALAALGAGSRSILTIHSGLAPPFVTSHAGLVGRVARRQAHLIAVNPEIAAALEACGVDEGRLSVIPAFSSDSLSFRLPPPGLAAIRRAHPLLIACALAPGREYGAEVMLDGFAAVRARRPDAGLVLYGPETRAPVLAAALQERGLASSVYLYGELTRPRALAIVAAADLFVRPTLADGDALSVREALGIGRPVVASAVGTRPPAAHLFAAGDAAALAESVFHALGNPAPKGERPALGISRILQIYAQLGLRRPCATIGTPLEIAPAAAVQGVNARSTPCVALPAV